MSYEEYRTKPFEDIQRADQLLNDDAQLNSDNVALAQALCSLATAKMMGRGR